MNIEYFDYFLEVADTLSVSKAARSFHMTQQGLSRAIQKIEQVYAVTLFDRDNNEIVLTPAGKKFYQDARLISDAHNRLISDVELLANNHSPCKSKVQLHVTFNVSNNIIYSFFDEIIEQCPNVIVSLIEETHDELIKSMSINPKNNSFAMISIPLGLQSIYNATSVSFEPLMDVSLMAMVHKSSKLAHHNAITRKDLEENPLVLHSDPALVNMLANYMNWTDPACALNNIIAQTNNMRILRDLVARNKAISFSNSFKYHYRKNENFKVIELEDRIQTPVFLVASKAVELSEEARQVYRVIQDIVNKNYPEVASGALF
ncbi:LysR family transcriptional regulator [Actinomycetota bacterium]|nr:LysR family transcriptional regulator [Actinomycetota bacterium]